MYSIANTILALTILIAKNKYHHGRSALLDSECIQLMVYSSVNKVDLIKYRESANDEETAVNIHIVVNSRFTVTVLSDSECKTNFSISTLRQCALR